MKNKRMITIEMACSINGIIAGEDGNEDFLSERGWEIMLEFLKEYDVLIWGRKTWDNILSWGDEYINDLKDINIIVIGHQNNDQEKSLKKECENKILNLNYCSSIEECLRLCDNLEYDKLFISGGASVNTAFMREKIVDKIILNYNPVVLNQGIPLFNENSFFENKLQLEKIVKEKEDIVQIHYKVIK